MREMFPELFIIGAVVIYMLVSAYKNGKLKGLIKTVISVAGAVFLAILVRSLMFTPFNIPSESMVSTLHIGDHIFVNKAAYGYSRNSFPYGIKLFNGIINDTPVERGDIVVFKSPDDNYTDFIKRTIGVPGDKIKVIGGILRINGEKVKKEYVGEHIFARIARGWEGRNLVVDGSDRTAVIKKNKLFLDGKEFEDASITYVNQNGCLSEDCSVHLLKKYKETLPNGKEYFVLEKSDNGLADNTPEFVVGEDEYFMMGDNRDMSRDSRFFGPVKKEAVIGRATFIFFSHNSRKFLGWLWAPWGQVKLDRFFVKLNSQN
ncbi:MAG: signal peptidase I [Rickettsiales bacterium]|jgi:signal peptidase I|nr:signal peptidase I [Rickettsiales bacterium]